MVGRRGRAGPARRARSTPPARSAALEVDGPQRARRPRRGGGARTCRSRSARGEILGVAGVAGNGQRELAEAITGMRPASRRGRARRGGRKLRTGDPRAAIAAGIAHVPEDRLGTGVAPSLSIAENSVLKSYRGRRRLARPAAATGAAIRDGARRPDRALRGADAGHARAARATSPAATCRSSCSAASSPASRRC